MDSPLISSSISSHQVTNGTNICFREGMLIREFLTLISILISPLAGEGIRGGGSKWNPRSGSGICGDIHREKHKLIKFIIILYKTSLTYDMNGRRHRKSSLIKGSWFQLFIFFPFNMKYNLPYWVNLCGRYEIHFKWKCWYEKVRKLYLGGLTF